MWFIALRHANTARTENRESRRGRNGKPSVRAIHPTDTFLHWRCQHARLAEHFQPNTGSHYVHDGIHGADFVKMNFLRRHTVDFSFRFGDALKNGQRFLLHPG